MHRQHSQLSVLLALALFTPFTEFAAFATFAASQQQKLVQGDDRRLTIVFAHASQQQKHVQGDDRLWISTSGALAGIIGIPPQVGGGGAPWTPTALNTGADCIGSEKRIDPANNADPILAADDATAPWPHPCFTAKKGSKLEEPKTDDAAEARGLAPPVA